MSIEEIAKIAGILGFFISVATFVLTRYERRASIIFGLDEGTSDDFDSELDEPLTTVNITITNLGARPLLVDLRTLNIAANNSTLCVWQVDHFWQ